MIPGNALQFRLWILGLKLFREEEELILRTRPEHESLFFLCAYQFERKRGIGRARLEPCLHCLRLQKPLLMRHDRDQMGTSLLHGFKLYGGGIRNLFLGCVSWLARSLSRCLLGFCLRRPSRPRKSGKILQKVKYESPKFLHHAPPMSIPIA